MIPISIYVGIILLLGTQYVHSEDVRIIWSCPFGTICTDYVFVSLEFVNFELGNGKSVCFTLSSVSSNDDDGGEVCFDDYLNEFWRKESRSLFSTTLATPMLTSQDYQIKATLRDRDQVVFQAVKTFTLVNSKSCGQLQRPRFLVDTIMLFDELDVLELRLQEIGDIVDLIVIVESEITHSGKPKPLHFKNATQHNMAIQPYLGKIRHIVVKREDFVDTDDADAREEFQRDMLLQGLKQVPDEALILIADVDEIPRREVVTKLKYCAELTTPLGLQLHWFHYAFNFKSPLVHWGFGGAYREGPIVVSRSLLTESVRPSTLRRAMTYGVAIKLSIWEDAGWHLSRFGGLDSVISKMVASPSIKHHHELITSGVISALVEAGLPVLPPFGNKFDGNSIFKPISSENVIQEGIPGGVETFRNPRYAHMFRDIASIVSSNKTIAAWEMLAVTLKGAIRSGEPLELFVISGVPQIVPPIVELKLDCLDTSESMGNMIHANICDMYSLTTRLCELVSSELWTKCTAQSSSSVSLKLQVNDTATFAYNSKSDTLTVSDLTLVYFTAKDNITQIMDHECDISEIHSSSREPFRHHIQNMFDRLCLMFSPKADEAPTFSANLTVTLGDGDSQLLTTRYSCLEQPNSVAERMCNQELRDGTWVNDMPGCIRMLSTRVSQDQSAMCSAKLEDWLDRPVRDFLRFLQWRILEESFYYGVKTWKFPFDLWVYQEILVADPPDVIVEVGNMYGGSVLYFARLFDTLNHHCRIIAVDIDHSNLAELPKSHPRISFIEDDALVAFEKVKTLIKPGEKVMVIEDASHTYQHTLEIMNRYSQLVTDGSWMIIEDTILHNGVENPYFNDPGAFKSVADFMSSQPDGHWKIDRGKERFVVSWNPTGFLQRLSGGAPVLSSKYDLDAISSKVLKRLREDKDILHVKDSDLIVDFNYTRQSVSNILNVGPITGLRRVHEVVNLVETAAGRLCVGDFICIVRLTVRCLMHIPKLQSKPLLLEPSEEKTILHTLEGEDVATTLTHGRGVAVLDGISEELASALREEITSHEDYKTLFMEPPERQSRYLSAIPGNGAEGSAPLTPRLVELFLLDEVLEPVSKLLGDDFLLDTTSVSIQWPGGRQFGPHVDRPFLTPNKNDDDMPYSVSGMKFPPKSYPLSVQAIVLLDNFTLNNGPFFFIPERGDFSEYLEAESLAWLNKVGPHVVTGRAGNIILAHGTTWHGALPNFTPRPRIALLIQYIPRFVRPGQQFPLSAVPPNSPQRLYELLDVYKPKRPETVVTLHGPSGDAVGSFQLDPNDAGSVGNSAARYVQLVNGDQSLAQAVAERAVALSLRYYEVCHPPRITTNPLSFVVGTGSVEKRQMRLSFGFGRNIPRVGDFVKRLLLMGWKSFDLAEMYPNQNLIGDAFGSIWNEDGSPKDPRFPHRREVFITSKLWATNMAPEHVEVALDATLQALQLSYVDVWLMHYPVPLAFVGIDGPMKGKTLPIDESKRVLYASGYTFVDTWKKMESIALDGTGRVRQIGVSNTPVAYLHLLLASGVRVRPAVNQVELHPFLPQDELVEACNKYGVPVQGYAPLGGGDSELLENVNVVAVAKRHAITPSQVLVVWSLQQARAGTVYSTQREIRAKEMHELVRNKEGLVVLDAEDLKALEFVGKRKRIYQDEFAASVLYVG